MGRGTTYGTFIPVGGRRRGWRDALLPTAPAAGNAFFSASISPRRRTRFSRLRSALVFDFWEARNGVSMARNSATDKL